MAQLLAATITIPWYSAFSEIFGRKAMLLTGVTFFTAGSFIAAVSGNYAGMHLGRVVQGVGAGGFCLLSDLVVADLVSEKERRMWSTLIGSAWAIGAVTGPMVGEALAERSQFRLLFWINMPIGVGALATLAVAAHTEPITRGPVLPKLLAFDWLGFVLFSGSLISVLLGLTRVSMLTLQTLV
jgi:MFS family permease